VAPTKALPVQKQDIIDFQLEDFDVDILTKWTPNHRPQAVVLNEFLEPHIQVAQYALNVWQTFTCQCHPTCMFFKFVGPLQGMVQFTY
jgi:hypothetical protein